jgi:hypothetical protein
LRLSVTLLTCVHCLQALIDIMMNSFEMTPMLKRLVVSTHAAGEDPIRLILDNNPNIEINHANFVAAAAIKLTDSTSMQYSPQSS